MNRLRVAVVDVLVSLEYVANIRKPWRSIGLGNGSDFGNIRATLQ